MDISLKRPKLGRRFFAVLGLMLFTASPSLAIVVTSTAKGGAGRKNVPGVFSASMKTKSVFALVLTDGVTPCILTFGKQRGREPFS
jgi:hypothetical protein